MRRLAVLGLVLAAAVAASAAGSATRAASCSATPNDGFGPFGRGLPPIRAKTGTGHVLSGVVLSAVDCKPVRGAQVQFWQSNAKGVYTKKLSATVISGRDGRFRYESPKPTSYEGFPPHIHIRVIAKGYETLLSRVVPAKGAKRTSIRLVLVPEAL
jgi:protocatechuate 3,4-dioxygenase beta subunit